MGITSPISHVFTTHRHWDHCNANEEIKAAFPDVRIYGHSDDLIPACTNPVRHGEEIVLFGGKIKIKCFHTPCHTKGHTIFYVESNICDIDVS